MYESTPSITRKAVMFAVTSLALAACSATTTEGISTSGCISGTTTLKLVPGDAFYLGDISSHEGPFNGRHEDWFKVENVQGAIVTSKDENGNQKDDGILSTTDEGFGYTERGRAYNVTYTNRARNDSKPIEVTIETQC